MASKLEIKRYAVNWLTLYPDRSEADTRAALRREFLGEQAPKNSAENPDGIAKKTTYNLASVLTYPVESIVGLVVVVCLAISRWWFRVNVEQTQNDIDAVIELLHEEGYWRAC